jgi:hypothetical protein
MFPATNFHQLQSYALEEDWQRSGRTPPRERSRQIQLTALRSDLPEIRLMIQPGECAQHDLMVSSRQRGRQ